MKLTLVAHIRKADLVLVDQVKEFFKQDPRFGFNRVRCAFYVKDGYQHFSVLIGGLEHLDITPPSVGPLENFLTSEVRNLLWVLGGKIKEGDLSMLPEFADNLVALSKMLLANMKKFPGPEVN